ncbi:hypothetical protein TrVE_jg13835 [Triparma verrucosa]|uniref:Uncharacterized protein n=1 Tax=Triparma verrucosa TaxID=1606542 RepID=A0A9W7FKH2_9STRA|nr:hypothetical protein TrVE_jg13835 [Triparma verrucosa]
MNKALPKEIQHEASFSIHELARFSFGFERKIQLVMILLSIGCSLVLFVHMPLRTVENFSTGSTAFRGAGPAGIICLFTLLVIECRLVIRTYKRYQARKLLEGDSATPNRSNPQKSPFSIKQLGGTEGATFVAEIL